MDTNGLCIYPWMIPTLSMPSHKEVQKDKQFPCICKYKIIIPTKIIVIQYFSLYTLLIHLVYLDSAGDGTLNLLHYR